MVGTSKIRSTREMSSKAPSKHIWITPKNVQRAESSLFGIDKLSNDLLLMVLDLLDDSHPESLKNLKLTCSQLHYLAEMITCRHLKLDLSSKDITATGARLDYIERRGFCSVIRQIEVLVSDDICHCSDCKQSSEDLSDVEKMQREAGIKAGVRGSKAKTAESGEDAESELDGVLDHFRKLLPQMTGLRDIFWPNENLSHATIRALPTDVRLHARTNDERQKDGHTLLVSKLRNNSKLYSLDVSHDFHGANNGIQVMRPVKELLVSNPNLRSLRLDINRPRTGRFASGRPDQYYGLNLANGERPAAALESLDIKDYPFGASGSQQDTGAEQNYWAENFDWSRLRRLHVSDNYLAFRLTSQLVALEDVRMYGRIQQTMQRFFWELQSPLKSIAVVSFAQVSLEGILRNKDTLKKLEMHQKENKKWREQCIDNESLARIRDECHFIEELRLDLARSGEWPWEALKIIAGFPRLQSLTIWLELGVSTWNDNAVVMPKVTLTEVQKLFSFLRENSPRQPSKLQKLHIHSGCPPDLGRGKPELIAPWPLYNSMEFLCKLSERDDEVPHGVFNCEFPTLGKEANMYLRGESKMLKAAEESDCYDLYDKEAEGVEVAEKGPKTRSEWHSHY